MSGEPIGRLADGSVVERISERMWGIWTPATTAKSSPTPRALVRRTRRGFWQARHSQDVQKASGGSAREALEALARGEAWVAEAGHMIDTMARRPWPSKPPT